MNDPKATSVLKNLSNNSTREGQVSSVSTFINIFYKKTIYKRKMYLYNICFHIKEINENTILFFDNSLEGIRKLYNLKEFLYQNI